MRYCVILSFLVAKTQMFVLKGEFFNKIIVTDNIILQSFTRILKVLDLKESKEYVKTVSPCLEFTSRVEDHLHSMDVGFS